MFGDVYLEIHGSEKYYTFIIVVVLLLCVIDLGKTRSWKFLEQVLEIFNGSVSSDDNPLQMRNEIVGVLF